MRHLYPSIVFAGLITAGAAIAQTTAPSAPAPMPPPGASSSTMSAAPTLTDEQAKSWVDKRVYSSDGKNLGEVAEMVRDSAGRVIEMHADIGGFLGIGETRVNVKPAQFSLGDDRVVLNLTAEQAKALPQVSKK